MDLAEAFKDWSQNLEDIQEKTEVDVERLENCKECGEELEGAMMLYPIQKQCVTVQCGACRTVYDIWSKEALEEKP